MHVGIDQGHGGRNFGTRSLGTPEKEYTFKMGDDLRHALRPYRLDVTMAREWDEDVSFPLRGSRLQVCDFVVSLHVNALSANRRAHGLQCYHLPEDELGKLAAHAIADRAPPELRRHRHRVIEAVNLPEDDSDNWLEAPITVLEPHRAAVLVEMFFGTNAKDREFGLSNLGQQRIIHCIVGGILEVANTLEKGVTCGG